MIFDDGFVKNEEIVLILWKMMSFRTLAWDTKWLWGILYDFR